ncbi:MAG TPA: hypothetical protein VF941_23830, partial [Clostridia bacterium]
NNTNEVINISHLEDFYLWPPGSINPYIGKYDIITKSGDEFIKLPKGSSLVSAKIIDKDNYISFYKSQKYSISLSIRTDKGLIISKDDLPFNSSSLKKYITEININ